MTWTVERKGQPCIAGCGTYMVPTPGTVQICPPCKADPKNAHIVRDMATGEARRQAIRASMRHPGWFK